MVEKLLKRYISNLKLEDIYNYALKNEIKLTEKEATIIYNCIKNDWEIIAFGNETIILNKYKNELQPKTYNKITELLNFYKTEGK